MLLDTPKASEAKLVEDKGKKGSGIGVIIIEAYASGGDPRLWV